METSSRKATRCFVVELGFRGGAATAFLDCSSESEIKGKGQFLSAILRSCLHKLVRVVFIVKC